MNLTCPSCGARFKIKDDALGTKGRKVKCGKCDHRWHAMPEGTASSAPAPARARAAAPAPADPTEDFAPPPPPPPPIADPTAAPAPPPPPVARAAARARPVEQEEEEPEEEDEEDEEQDEEDEIPRGVPASMRADPPPIPPESSFEPRTSPEEPSGGTMRYWVLLAILLIGGGAASIFWRDLVVHHFPAANKAFMMVGLPANTLGYGLKINTPETSLDVKTRQIRVSGEIVNETGKIIEVPLLKAILLNSKGEPLKSWTFDAKEPRILPGEKVGYETAAENPPSGATNLKVTFTRAEEEATGQGDGAQKDKPAN